jgi:hypothetical protein
MLSMPQISWSGVTFNLVTVTGTFLTIGGNAAMPGSGNVQFTCSDIAWSTTYGLVGNLAPLGVMLDGTGSFSVDLFAMDNPEVSTNWSWVISGAVSGVQIASRPLIINYANGESQTLASLLAA